MLTLIISSHSKVPYIPTHRQQYRHIHPHIHTSLVPSCVHPSDPPCVRLSCFLCRWTTIGGWPGLIKWAGSPDWSGRNNKPATAEFEILSVPNDA